MQDTHKNEPFTKAIGHRKTHNLGIAALALLGLVTAPAALAQSYTLNTLFNFSGGANGSNPVYGLTKSDNTLYGTTELGGAHNFGTIFSIPTTGGSPTVVANFNSTNVGGPGSNLIQSGNTLYGNSGGGPYSVPITGGTPTLLTNFSSTNEIQPSGNLILNDGILYGTTTYGGNYIGTNGNPIGYGTVYSVPITGGTPTLLASFNGTNGYYPYGLILSGTTLYGTTDYGGTPGPNGLGYGTMYSLPITGGIPTVLANFNASNEGYPVGFLTQSSNTIYGITAQGTNNTGTVYSVPITGGTPTTLATFNAANGGYPYGDIVLSGNTIYGTTFAGGANSDGTVFSVPISGGTPTTLATFNGANGENPDGLTLIGDTLYGTTGNGGANGDGTIFSLTPAISAAPEPSSWVSLGLMFAFGLGCNARARKRAKSQEKVQH